MKVLILAGGRGSRFNKITESQNKCMLKVGGKPLIEYSLDIAGNLEISEIVIVVGHKAEQIMNAYGDQYSNKPIKYVVQPKQKGLVHAINCAKEVIGNEDFILMLGDELMLRANHNEIIREYHDDENLFGICGVVNVENKDLIKKTYTVIQGEDDKIFRLIEKPSNPMNNIMGTGNCVFNNKIFSYINQTPINQRRGEKELVDLIQCAIDDGNMVKSSIICDQYVNVNSMRELDESKSYFTHFSS
ncbi:nucleotidyltransferase family protein [Candidatus Parcubacteria bacterium]|nr:nucleotidyltransferase family protein [Candidatus Parcubacteria bacterium]